MIDIDRQLNIQHRLDTLYGISWTLNYEEGTMTQVITPIEQALLDKVRSLPLERQQEVLDFAEFLAIKANAKATHDANNQPAAPLAIDVRQLSGMLYQAGRQTVSLEEIDQAIAECAEESA